MNIDIGLIRNWWEFFSERWNWDKVVRTYIFAQRKLSSIDDIKLSWAYSHRGSCFWKMKVLLMKIFQSAYDI